MVRVPVTNDRAKAAPRRDGTNAPRNAMKSLWEMIDTGWQYANEGLATIQAVGL
jgi:hypothetical protein